MFGTQPRQRLPSYGGLGSYDDYDPLAKPARRSSAGRGGGALLWGVGLALTAALAVLGWQLHATRSTMEQLQLHIDVVEQNLVVEKVRWGRAAAASGLRTAAPQASGRSAAARSCTGAGG